MKDPRSGSIRYVGVTLRKRRLVEHISRARKMGRTHRDCWIRGLLALGAKPEWAILEEGRGDGWQDAERTWIATLRSQGERLTNLTDGGDGTPGQIPSAAQRLAHSKRMKGRKYPPGRRSAMLGHHHSLDARAKIAAASTGRSHSPATRAAIAKAAQGRDMTACIRRSVKARTGVPLTAEHKWKIAATRTNRKRVLCVETMRTYPSITATALALRVTEASVYQAIRKGCRCKGNHYRVVL